MAQRYTTEEKDEAVKLAEEIGVASAARRLGIRKPHFMDGEAEKKKSK